MSIIFLRDLITCLLSTLRSIALFKLCNVCPFPGWIGWNHWCMGFTYHQTIKEWQSSQWSTPNHVPVPRPLQEWRLHLTSGQSWYTVMSVWLHIQTNYPMWHRHLQSLQLSDGGVTAASSRWCLSSSGFILAFNLNYSRSLKSRGTLFLTPK